MTLQSEPTGNDASIVHYRIERGARAEGTDGLLGTVEQIVVDRVTGALRAIIVHASALNEDVEVPASHVADSTGSHVYLDLSQEDLLTGNDIVRRYDPAHYMPVSQGEQPEAIGIASERPVVTNVEEDAVEVLAPERIEVPETTAPTAPPAGAASEPVMSEDLEAQSPTPQPSRDPSTTGDMIHDRPTTSGMGIKSSVPRSPVSARDSSPIEPVPESASDIMPAPDETPPPARDALMAATAQVEPVAPPSINVHPASIEMPEAHASTILPETRPISRDTVTDVWQTPGGRATLAAAGTAVLLLALLRALARGRRRPEGTARGTSPSLLHQLNWFLWGTALGSGTAVVLAPMPGAQLRERIALAVERWREDRVRRSGQDG